MNDARRHKARLVLTGHIIDSMILPQVMDLVMDLGGNFTIEELRVGQHKTDTSYCRMEVVASTAEQLDTIVKGARALGAASESERPARLERVIKEGVFPEGFYSTSNLPTEVFSTDRGSLSRTSRWTRRSLSTAAPGRRAASCSRARAWVPRSLSATRACG
jgi:hypothetical protein